MIYPCVSKRRKNNDHFSCRLGWAPRLVRTYLLSCVITHDRNVSLSSQTGYLALGLNAGPPSAYDQARTTRTYIADPVEGSCVIAFFSCCSLPRKHRTVFLLHLQTYKQQYRNTWKCVLNDRISLSKLVPLVQYPGAHFSSMCLLALARFPISKAALLGQSFVASLINSEPPPSGPPGLVAEKGGRRRQGGGSILVRCVVCRLRT